MILDRDITILRKTVELTDGGKTEFVEPVDNWTPSSVYVSNSRK